MKKPFIAGIIAGLVLLVLYFGVLSIANSFSHALQQFADFWYWISLLVAGFGIQVGLYSHIRAEFHARKMAGATTSVAASGGVSTGAMIACCAHHLTDVLPLIGLAAAAVFLVKYQMAFIILGVLSNLVGITLMLEIIQKHSLFDHKNNFLKGVFKLNMKSVRNITIILSVLIFVLVLAGTVAWGMGERPGSLGKPKILKSLPAKTNKQAGVTIKLKPGKITRDKDIKFNVSVDTHSGSLDFDLTKISVLVDDEGNKYRPIKWEGDPPGGHHRSGTLTFPALKTEGRRVKVIIKNVYGVKERVFIWESTGL